MGLIAKIKNMFKKGEMFKMMDINYNAVYTWDGKMYSSDLIRSSIRPFTKAVGKAVAKHIRCTVRNGENHIDTYPDVYMRFLLEEPNPLMSMQVLQEKAATQLILQ